MNVIKCNFPGCSHTEQVSDPGTPYFVKLAVEVMIEHYKWIHADAIGTRVENPGMFQDDYTYTPYSTWQGPTREWTKDDGTTGHESWAELIEKYSIED